MKMRGFTQGKKTLKILPIAALLLIFLPLSLESEKKDFYFPQVRIEINIERDGSFVVDERRTYDFQGSFSWATLWIPLKVRRQAYEYELRVEDFRVYDEKENLLTFEQAADEERFSAKWFYRAKDEKRTFHIHYRIKGGIRSYPEVSELYWQAIGSGWEKPTAFVSIDVFLPEPVPSKDDILIYGHGPLSGWAEIVDTRRTRFSAQNLLPHQSLEIRVVWPSGMVSGIPSELHTRESIKKEEAKFVEETIEKARLAEAKREKEKKLVLNLLKLWATLLIVVSLLWFFVFLFLWKKKGRDYHFNDIPEYYHELPSELRPALVEVLRREGGLPTTRSFTATLFDLARRGYLELEDRIVEKKWLFGVREKLETTLILKKNYQHGQDLLPYEIDLLDFIFFEVSGAGNKPGAKVQVEELKSFLKSRPRDFQEWYRKWIEKVEKETKVLGFIEPSSLRIKKIYLLITIFLALLTLNPVLLVLAAVFLPRLKRRERRWARENELWEALDRFLDDFSEFRDLPPEAYKLWEHFLVFGILFGNAKNILKQLPLILKDERASVPVWYQGYESLRSFSSRGIESMIGSIERASTVIHKASTSAAHYSSGSGGGFSGGRGGGGGGGGGSAG